MKAIFHLFAVPTTQHWNHLPGDCTDVFTIYLVRQGEATHLCSLTPSTRADFIEHVFVGLDPEHPFVGDHAYQDDELTTYFDYLDFNTRNHFLSAGFEVEIDPREFSDYEDHHEESMREAQNDALWEEAREYVQCNPPMILAVEKAQALAEENAEKYYAVQYRDMHTAIHHIAVFENEDVAREYKDYIIEAEQHPLTDPPEGYIDDVEINFRHPPERYGDRYDGVRLEYILEGGIPSVW